MCMGKTERKVIVSLKVKLNLYLVIMNVIVCNECVECESKQHWVDPSYTRLLFERDIIPT